MGRGGGGAVEREEEKEEEEELWGGRGGGGLHAQTQKKYFDIDPKRKHIKRHFYTCLLQAQKAEMVSGENKTEGLFLPTIALSYKNLLESLASPQCQPPSPPPPSSSASSLALLFLPSPHSEAGQGPRCALIGCGLMLSNNIPVP